MWRQKKKKKKKTHFFLVGDDRGDELGQMYGVEGIPCLIIIDAKTGKTINAEGRAAVGGDLEAKEFPWFAKKFV